MQRGGRKKKRLINPRWLRRTLFTPLSELIVQRDAPAPSVGPAGEPTSTTGQEPRPDGASPSAKPRRMSIRSRNTKPGEEAAPKPGVPQIVPCPRSDANLQLAWEEFLGFIRPRSELHYATLRSYMPELQGEHAVRLVVRNRLDMQYLEALAEKLMGFLRLKFTDPELTLETAIDPQARQSASLQVMRVADYLEALQGENPALGELFTRFKLRPL